MRLLETTKNKSIKNNKQSELISVVLVCDSPGYRMKSYGPLSLVSIKNLKLIDHQIQAIINTFENYEIVLCLGFDSEKVCRYIRSKYKSKNIRIVENQLYNSSNSCESLRISLNNILNNKIIVCDGNLLLNKKSLNIINTNISCALFEKKPTENLEVGFNKDDFNNIQYFSYGAKYIWSEICFLNGEAIIEDLRKILTSYDSKTRFIFEAINELIKMRYEFKAIQNQHPIIKLNNIKTYNNFKE